MKRRFERVVRADRTSVSARGERGASITIALLLLLVCALLTSIILAATSGVTGRHIQLGERDQHYYGAVSAAKLLKQEIDKQVVHVKCKETTVSSREVTYDETGRIVGTPPDYNMTSGPTYSVVIIRGNDDDEFDEHDDITFESSTSPSDEGPVSLSLLEQTALNYLAGTVVSTDDNPNPSDIWSNMLDDTSRTNPVKKQYVLTATPTNTNNALKQALEVKVEQEIKLESDSNGDGAGEMKLTITSGTEPASDDESQYSYYRLQMLCDADIDIEESTATSFSESGQTASESSFTRTETKEDIVVRRITMSWKTSELDNRV